MNELINRRALDIITSLKCGEITPHDLLDALETRISEVDKQINALPTLCFDRARKHADDLLKKKGGRTRHSLWYAIAD